MAERDYLAGRSAEIVGAHVSGAAWRRSQSGFDDQRTRRRSYTMEHPAIRAGVDRRVFLRFDEDR